MPWVQKEVVEIVRLNFSKLDIISLKLINQTRGYCQNRIQVICPSTLILVDKGFNQKSVLRDKRSDRGSTRPTVRGFFFTKHLPRHIELLLNLSRFSFDAMIKFSIHVLDLIQCKYININIPIYQYIKDKP